MNLNVESWKEFRLGDLSSEMYKAEAHVKGELECYDVPSDNTIRFISRTEMNNGCDCYVLNNDLSGIEKANAIAIGDTTATCFYQGEDFVCGDHMIICRADWINLHTALFIISILKQEKYKYSYGRAFKMELISNTMLKLPATADNTPDWQFMEDYIKSLHYKPLTTKNKPGQAPDLNVQEWKEFKIKDLFGIRRGSITSLNEIDEGTTPIVSASGDNEGIDFFGNVPALRNNNITISMNGVNTGFTAYHGYDFNINIDCCVLIQKFTMNAYIGEFIATIIGKLRCKYSYGRKMSAERIMKETIKLPVNSSGNPDWQFMENYIKALPYGDRLP